MLSEGEFGINRNIVECKDETEKILIVISGCINRNIVECKDLLGRAY